MAEWTTGILPKVVALAFVLVSCTTWETALWLSMVQLTLRNIFLLPLFQDWTFATLATLPSVSQMGASSDARPAFRSWRTTTSVPRNSTTCTSPSTAPSLQPLPSSPVPRLPGTHLSRPTTHFAIWGPSNWGSPHGTCSCLSTSFLPCAPVSLTPCFHTDRGPLPVVQCWSSSCTLPLCHFALHFPSPIRLCSRRGCTSPAPPLCSTGHCVQLSQSQVSVAPPFCSPASCSLVLLASLAQVVLLVALLLFIPSVLWASPPTHCTSRRCQRRSRPTSVAPLPTTWLSGTSSTWLSCGFLQFALHDPPVVWCMFLSPCWETAKGRVADEWRRHDPHSSRSISWFGSAQLSPFVESWWFPSRWFHGLGELPWSARGPSASLLIPPTNGVWFVSTSWKQFHSVNARCIGRYKFPVRVWWNSSSRPAVNPVPCMRREAWYCVYVLFAFFYFKKTFWKNMFARCFCFCHNNNWEKKFKLRYLRRDKFTFLNNAHVKNKKFRIMSMMKMTMNKRNET